MALVTRGWAQRAGAAADMGRHSSTPMRPVCRKSSVICSATNAGAEEAPSRRQLLASGVTAAACIALAPARPAAADEAAGTEYTTLLGLATPPTSYGGYGGNDPNATPKYSFEYPSSWKPEVPNKVEKGTQGVDSRVVNQRQKGA